MSDLFDWWERAIGALSSSYMTDQQLDAPDDRTTKKGKKAGCFSCFLADCTACTRIDYWHRNAVCLSVTLCIVAK